MKRSKMMLKGTVTMCLRRGVKQSTSSKRYLQLLFSCNLCDSTKRTFADDVGRFARRRSFASTTTGTIDLRSDTITRPSLKMRQRMSTADVGDDVFNEDPTVHLLQGEAAKLMGKEAALFVPSGCMANLIAIGLHCRRGDELMCGRDSHVFLWEAGGASAFLGVSYMCLPNRTDGTISSEDILKGIRVTDPHCPTSRLLCLENTHNMCGGIPIGAADMHNSVETAKAAGLLVHVDGARIMNAAVALGVPPKELVAGADTVSFCLSKGLGAPAGSLLCGTAAMIERARYLRKALGGGMRQSGVLAAAGLEALSNNIDRLAIDHSNARLFAEGIADVEGITVDLSSIKTNMVYFSIDVSQLKGKSTTLPPPPSCNNDAHHHEADYNTVEAAVLLEDLVQQMAAKDILLGGGYGHGGVLCRAVTHLDVTTEQIVTAVRYVKEIMHDIRRRLRGQ